MREIFFRFKIGNFYIYISTCGMRRRSPSDERLRNNHNKLKRWKHNQWKKRKGMCEICGGKFGMEEMEVHHIKPRSKRPDLIVDKRNLKLVCHECHRDLHNIHT